MSLPTTPSQAPSAAGDAWFTSALFWCMMLTGGAGVAACLILPAWLEHRGALEVHRAALADYEKLAQRLRAIDLQIEHLRTDDAYLQRIVRREYGISPPGVVTLPGAEADPPVIPMEAPTPAPPRPLLERLSSQVDALVQRYPLMSMFVLDQTRPLVLAISLGFMAGAMLVIRPRAGRATFARPARSPSRATARDW